MDKKVIVIEGMMCSHCAERVKKTLEDVEGVSKVEVDFKKGTATVKLEREVPEDILSKAIAEAGYTVAAIKRQNR